MKKNHIIKSFRVSAETKKLIQEVCEALGFNQQDLIRFLLNKSLQELKADSIQAKGYENLSITLKDVR